MSVASVAVPTVAATASDRSGLAEKVNVRHLDFFYGNARSLKSINVALYENKVTAIIGPSGCGKSTLLRVLNRMYDLYPNQRATGEVMFDGENILSPKQSQPKPDAEPWHHCQPRISGLCPVAARTPLCKVGES